MPEYGCDDILGNPETHLGEIFEESAGSRERLGINGATGKVVIQHIHVIADCPNLLAALQGFHRRRGRGLGVCAHGIPQIQFVDTG